MKNYRIRKLIDGRYVAEVKTGWWIFSIWEAISKTGSTWDDPAMVRNYCLVSTREEAEDRIKLLQPVE